MAKADRALVTRLNRDRAFREARHAVRSRNGSHYLEGLDSGQVIQPIGDNDALKRFAKEHGGLDRPHARQRAERRPPQLRDRSREERAYDAGVAAATDHALEAVRDRINDALRDLRIDASCGRQKPTREILEDLLFYLSGDIDKNQCPGYAG